MTKTLAEKIGVVAMFILVMVVFSLAERDTQKFIQQDSKAASSTNPTKELAASEQRVQLATPLLTRK
jgi:hypothetical protein